MSEAVADRQTLSGADAMAALEQMAEQQNAPRPPKEQKKVEEAVREQLAAFEYQEEAVELPAGWRLREWRQGTLLTIFEDGPLAKALEGGYDNRWRRNGEVVKSVLEHGGFDVKGIEPDDIDDMDWRDVEKIFFGVVTHYNNTVLVKKK